MDGQGNLESQGKVREFENKWLWQAVSRKFIYSVQKGKRCPFSRDSQSPSPFSLGLPLKKRICSPRERILLSFKSNPQIRSNTVITIKVKNNVFSPPEGTCMENCKMPRKNQGI